MLKIELKKMMEIFTVAQIEEFIENNFFNIKTSDVMKLRTLIGTMTTKARQQETLWNSNFQDKQSIFSLAVLRLKQVHGDEIEVNSLYDLGKLTDKQYNDFWKFARRIAEYKNSQKANTKRIKHRWALTRKR